MDHFYTKLYDTNKPLLTIVDDFGNVFFNASDAAKILGYGNRSQKVIAERISEDCKVHLDEIKVNIEKENYDKRKYKNNSIFLRECGLYELTLGSNKEMATEFKKWITHDLLPELRAKSEYFISERIKFIDGNPNEAEITIKDLKDKNQKLNKIPSMKPKNVRAKTNNITGGGNQIQKKRNILGGHGEHENNFTYDLLADIEVDGVEYPIKTLLKMGYRIEFTNDFSQYMLLYPGELYPDEEYETSYETDTDSNYSNSDNEI